MGALLPSACGEVVGPRVLDQAPAAIRSFVLGQNLTDLRRYQVLLSDPAHDFLAFRLTYGPPQDRPSGCFYLGAWGIQYGPKVGWVAVDTLPPYAAPGHALAVDSTDTYLYGSDVRLRVKALGLMQDEQYRLLLARQPHLPEAALYDLARELPAYGDFFVANALLDNPRVRSSRPILTYLANLSGGPYDWTTVRARAAALLA